MKYNFQPFTTAALCVKESQEFNKDAFIAFLLRAIVHN